MFWRYKRYKRLKIFKEVSKFFKATYVESLFVCKYDCMEIFYSTSNHKFYLDNNSKPIRTKTVKMIFEDFGFDFNQ